MVVLGGMICVAAIASGFGIDRIARHEGRYTAGQADLLPLVLWLVGLGLIGGGILT